LVKRVIDPISTDDSKKEQDKQDGPDEKQTGCKQLHCPDYIDCKQQLGRGRDAIMLSADNQVSSLSTAAEQYGTCFHNSHHRAGYPAHPSPDNTEWFL
jgi:hypothetical protein